MIVFKHKYPEEFIEYEYPEVLEEVFAFYECLMVDEEYWGFKGETCVSGHILEHYAMDHRKPKSMEGLQYMIENQGSDGKYNISNVNFLGAQVHGMKGLYRCMQVFNFEY